MEQKIPQIKVDSNVVLPMPVVLVGSALDAKPNFMTVAWAMRVNAKPPMLAVALNEMHASTEAISRNGTFSVCVPSADMMDIVDYCGIVSADKKDKSKLFNVFYGELPTAPMIAECPLNIECAVAKTVDLPTNKLFIGRIEAVYAQEEVVKKGKVDVPGIDPLLLTMWDNTYWKLGEKVGNAWKDSLKYTPKS